MAGSQDLRQPMNLSEQVLQSSGMCQDVGLAMQEMLQGDSHTTARKLLVRASSHIEKAWGTPQMLRPHKVKFDEDEWEPASDKCHWWTFAVNSWLLPCPNAFGLPEESTVRFFRCIENGYLENPYHSRTHAANVLQNMHLLITHGLLQDIRLEGLTILACYLAAIVHDFGHPGVNNDFLIKTRDHLALTHNDASPLENHHISSANLLALSHQELHFTRHMLPEDESNLRSSVIELVLAADMKKHFENRVAIPGSSENW
ncbi:hypothetical protein WJX84_005118 [Apatococcus fuscideae]|uniref:PDEase domain-containing protein n=1 Tax=Apatococcus fuscideae TaxID=2026836 RepID=A0AAW1SNJ0_9CHLO